MANGVEMGGKTKVTLEWGGGGAGGYIPVYVACQLTPSTRQTYKAQSQHAAITRTSGCSNANWKIHCF